MRLLTIVFLLLTHSLVLTTAAHAQSATATLSGTVVDEQGAIVPGATVQITDAARSFERQTTTNGEGSFVFVQLQPTNYTVTIERGGFANTEVRDVILNVGDQRVIRINLKVAAIGATVTVESAGSLISA